MVVPLSASPKSKRFRHRVSWIWTRVSTNDRRKDSDRRSSATADRSVNFHGEGAGPSTKVVTSSIRELPSSAALPQKTA